MLKELLRNKNFMLVWWAGLISMLGNYMLFIALPVYIFEKTGSTLSTVFIDRWQYKRTLVIANFILVFITLAFLLITSLPWWVVLPVAFLQSAVGQFLGPAENALLPTLVDNEHLAAANSLNALNNNLARLAGPALGGLLLSTVGFAGVVIVDAATYLAAVILLLFVNAPHIKREVSRVLNPYKRLFSEWREGVQVVKRNKSLTLSFIVVALTGLGEGTISTLMAPYVGIMLDGGGLELGYIMSAQAVGGIVAGLLLANSIGRIQPLRLLGWSALGAGLLDGLLLTYPLFYKELWPALVVIALAGFPFAAFATAQMTILQRESPAQARGRAFSSYFALFAFTQLVGILGSGLLGDTLGVLIINTQAVGYVLAGVIVLIASRNSFHQEFKRPYN
jgi:predicted MFS family arabinose efflux permease